MNIRGVIPWLLQKDGTVMEQTHLGGVRQQENHVVGTTGLGLAGDDGWPHVSPGLLSQAIQPQSQF